MDTVSEKRECAPHQQRVVTERQELADNLQKLKAFFANPIFDGLPQAEKERLKRQAVHMGDYLGVLNERIEAF